MTSAAFEKLPQCHLEADVEQAKTGKSQSDLVQDFAKASRYFRSYIAIDLMLAVATALHLWEWQAPATMAPWASVAARGCLLLAAVGFFIDVWMNTELMRRLAFNFEDIDRAETASWAARSAQVGWASLVLNVISHTAWTAFHTFNDLHLTCLARNLDFAFVVIISTIRSWKLRRLFRFSRAMHSVAQVGHDGDLCTVFEDDHEGKFMKVSLMFAMLLLALLGWASAESSCMHTLSATNGNDWKYVDGRWEHKEDGQWVPVIEKSDAAGRWNETWVNRSIVMEEFIQLSGREDSFTIDGVTWSCSSDCPVGQLHASKASATATFGAAGALSGAAGGVEAGALVGTVAGPPGMALGAAVGAAGGLVGGIITGLVVDSKANGCFEIESVEGDFERLKSALWCIPPDAWFEQHSK